MLSVIVELFQLAIKVRRVSLLLHSEFGFYPNSQIDKEYGLQLAINNFQTLKKAGQ